MNKTAINSPDLDARVHQFGQRVGAALNQQSAQLPRDVTERLRFARETAVARAQAARAAQAQQAHSSRTTSLGHTLALNDGGQGRHGFSKWISALPLVLLIAGLLLIHRGQVHEQIEAAAEVDTALLSDQVPPAAYSDPGFAEFLHTEKD
jgi:hypothetical protein